LPDYEAFYELTKTLSSYGGEQLALDTRLKDVARELIAADWRIVEMVASALRDECALDADEIVAVIRTSLLWGGETSLIWGGKR
jgi:hypothetical protein